MRRVALISGASKGLGAELVRFLAPQEFTLIITARGQRGLEKVAEEANDLGAQITAIPGDVAHPVHRHRLAEAAEGAGRLDLLINNASTLGPTPMPDLVSYPLDQLERVFAVNVIAPLGLIQETHPLLAQSGGLIVNISSDAATGDYHGWGGYGSSKAALDSISRTIARELDSLGIATVSVDPGDMRTEMHQRAFPGEDISDRPSPEVTLPFWAWLISQAPESVNGRRFQAQAELWKVAG